MPALALAIFATAAVIVLGIYVFRSRNDDEPTPSSPYYSTSSEELAGIEDLEFAKKLREQGQRSGREMSEAYNRAKSAQRMGDRWAAQEHRQQADAHKGAMEELNKRAAKIIFREKNKVCS